MGTESEGGGVTEEKQFEEQAPTYGELAYRQIVDEIAEKYKQQHMEVENPPVVLVP